MEPFMVAFYAAMGVSVASIVAGVLFFVRNGKQD